MMKDFKIKPGLRESYIHDMGRNCQDAYSFGVVTAVVAVLGSLDSDDTPEVACGKMEILGISMFMASCVASMVSRYSVRGDEFRLYWNQRYGVDEFEAKGGIVNPSVMLLGSEKTE